MRVAIVSDIHGNRTAFEAVLKDLQETSPDLILHGGDLADFGSSPVDVVDQIRDLGWDGVLGNTDEMHVRPAALDEFASSSTAFASMWIAIREMAGAVHARLGAKRISWLSTLPRIQMFDAFALVHASAQSTWRSPQVAAEDSELENAFGPLLERNVVFGHIHHPFVRELKKHNRLVMNSGSVGMPYDGDPRATYLLIDPGRPEIRRVEYSVDAELRALAETGLPHSHWIARTLRAASPQLP